MNTRNKGNIGETLAKKYLKKLGYKIICENYHASKMAEIDLIAKDKDFLVFVEVKLRYNTLTGYGREAVTKQKQQNIIYGAKHYLTTVVKKEVPVRFDVIEITFTDEIPEIEHIQNAF